MSPINPATGSLDIEAILARNRARFGDATMTTPAPPAPLDPMTSVLARDWAVEVNTGTFEAPSWTRIRGLTTVRPTVSPTTEDDSDFDGGEWGSDVTTQLKWALECEGNRKRKTSSPTTFVPDPGQEAIRAAGVKTGVAGTVDLRFYRTDGSPDAHRGFATIEYGGGGGGVTSLEPFSFTARGQGARLDITNPTTETTPET